MGSLHPNYTMKILLIFALLFGISWAQLDCSNCAYNSYQANICCATGNSYCCQFATGNQNQGGQVGGSNYYPGGSSSSSIVIVANLPLEIKTKEDKLEAPITIPEDLLHHL